MNLDSPRAGILISTLSNGLRVRQLYRLGRNEGLFRLGNLRLPSVGDVKVSRKVL